MPQLRHKETGQVYDVPDAAVLDALATGLYEAPAADAQIPVNIDGLRGQVSGADLGYAAGIGATPETEEQFRARERKTRVEREHGGALGTAATFVEQGLDTATLGGFGAFTDVAFGDDYTEARRERVEANPIASVAGTVTGAVVPAIAGAGTGTVGALARLTPGGAASALGAGIASRGGIAALAGGAATEGAFFGAGQVLAESILQDKELHAEAFLAGASKGALWGGAAGAGFGLLSSGARAGKRAVERATSGRDAQAAIRSLEKEADTAAKEAKRAAREAERLRLEAARTENRAALEAQKQGGRLQVIEAHGKNEIAKADAQAIAAKQRAEQANEALKAEQARYETEKMVMDKRLELADVYKSGWRRAAESREQVADVGADAKMRTGLAKALAETDRPDRGFLIEELIPEKMRTPAAVESARGEVLNQAARTSAEMDDLVRQTDEIIALNPQLEAELRPVRDRAAALSPRMTEWAEKQAGSRAFQEAHLDELKAAGFTAETPIVARAVDDAVAPPAAAEPAAPPPAPGNFPARRNAWAREAMPKLEASASEMSAATDYATEFQSINGALRGDEGKSLDDALILSERPVSEAVADLDATIARSVIPEDVLLYRGVRPRDGFDARTLKPGDVIQEPAYTSTSLSEMDAARFQGNHGVIFEIEAPAGQQGLFINPLIGEVVGESEILLPRGLSFRVLSMSEDRGWPVARLRIEPEAGAAAAPEAAAPAAPAAPAVADDFADGLDTIQSAEQARHDLAQAIRPYLDEANGMSLDDAIRGMDDAVAKQDEIVEDLILKRAEAAVDDAPSLPDPEPLPGAPEPVKPAPTAPAAAAPRQGADPTSALGVMDLAAAASGLPNLNDIPVIGPLLGTWLKYRALAGALRHVGMRVGGPVASLARQSAQIQNAARKAAVALATGVEKGAAPAARASASMTASLSEPLWDPLEESEAPAAPLFRGQKPNSPNLQRLFEQRQEEILRATEDPEAAKALVADAIPAPPQMARAVADAWYRGIEWLAGQMPTDPRAPGLSQAPYQYPVPDLQRFSEAVRVVRQPVTVLQAMASGAVSPVAAEGLKVVWPRLFQEVQGEIVEQLAKSKRTIPPARKSLLASLFELPLDGTTSPEYTAARQEEYAMAEQQQPQPTGPKLQISSQHQLGPIRRASR